MRQKRPELQTRERKTADEKKVDENSSEEKNVIDPLEVLLLITSSYENQTEPIPA